MFLNKYSFVIVVVNVVLANEYVSHCRKILKK
jgi:hypothetical protein